MTTTVLGTVDLISLVPFGTGGDNDETPTACMLGDGTSLVASSVRATNTAGGAAYASTVQIWHLGTDGSLLGQTSIDGGANFVDTTLGWAGGTNAILCVNFSPTGGGTGTNSTFLINASGATPTVGAGMATTFATQSTNIFGVHAFYDSATSQTLFAGKNGFALYSTVDGSQVASQATNNNRWYGAYRKPGTTGTFGFRNRENGVYGGYEVVLSPGGMTVTPHSEWAPSQDWWLLGAMDPYAATLAKFENNSGDAMEVSAGGTSLVTYPHAGGYLNYEGVCWAGAAGQSIVSYEVGTAGAGPGGHDLYQIGLADISVSGTPSAVELVLDEPYNSVSLSYCSFGGDTNNGKMVMAFASNTVFEGSGRYSLRAWVLDIGGTPPPPPPPPPEPRPAITLTPNGFITDTGAAYLLGMFSGAENAVPGYYLALSRTVPTVFSHYADLEEPDAADYQRLYIVNGDGWNRLGAALYNDIDAVFPAATNDWGTVLGWAVLDAAEGGRLLFGGDLITSVSIPVDTVVTIERGQLAVSMAVTDWALED